MILGVKYFTFCRSFRKVWPILTFFYIKCFTFWAYYANFRPNLTLSHLWEPISYVLIALAQLGVAFSGVAFSRNLTVQSQSKVFPSESFDGKGPWGCKSADRGGGHKMCKYTQNRNFFFISCWGGMGQGNFWWGWWRWGQTQKFGRWGGATKPCNLWTHHSFLWFLAFLTPSFFFDSWNISLTRYFPRCQ